MELGMLLQVKETASTNEQVRHANKIEKPHNTLDSIAIEETPNTSVRPYSAEHVQCADLPSYTSNSARM